MASELNRLRTTYVTGRPFALHLDWCRHSIPSHEDVTKFMKAYDQLFW